MTDSKREQLRKLIEADCLIIVDPPITLSTGVLSHYYFDCKEVTLSGQGLSLLSEAFLDEIRKLPEMPIAIGGLTMGADFITAAVAMKAFECGLPTIYGSIVRKEPKKHGTRNKVEHELARGTSIVVVDDVITTGNSTKLACEEFLKHGYRIVGIIALVDREEGGRANLEASYSVPVSSLFKKSDFPKADHADDNVRSNQGRIAAAA